MKLLKPRVTFLTGGTGFLGSHIGAELLQRGEETYFLIRGGPEAAARLEKTLDWHGIDRALRTKAHLIEGELRNSSLGIDRKALSRIDRIIHCASDTSFSERNRRRVWTTNVDGLKAIMDFAVDIRCHSFIDLSTVYVAGRRGGLCLEEPLESKGFHNVYEESKAAAEHMLLEGCQDKGIRLIILRPSIVYGDSQTGRTFRFNALYYPVKTTLFLRKIFEEDIRERGGEKASEMGVRREQDGTIELPLRIEVCENSGVNLIPVDFFVDAFFAIIENSSDGGIHHIVNPKQTKIADIIGYVKNQFKLKGIRACSQEEFQRTPRNSLEQLFQRYVEAYSPYMKDTRIFLSEKTNPVLKRSGLVCPEFDENMFRRCMSFAVENEWLSLSI